MINDGFVYRDQVPAEADGWPVIEFYASRYRRFSRAVWLDRIRNGQVRRRGVPLTAQDRLRAGDHLSYHRPGWEEPPVPSGVAVCYRDDRILVVDKPAGIPTLPGDQYLHHSLLAIVRKQFGDRWSPMHRLDRGTSGLVLFAGDREARKRLGHAMESGEIQKTYLCVTVRCPQSGTVRVRTSIGRVAHALVDTIAAPDPDGRPAATSFRPVRPLTGDRGLVVAVLQTGRAHQIRIHAAVAGFPLVGDPVYGHPGGQPNPKALPGAGGYFLHAWRLRFPHPDQGRRVRITATPSWRIG